MLLCTDGVHTVLDLFVSHLRVHELTGAKRQLGAKVNPSCYCLAIQACVSLVPCPPPCLVSLLWFSLTVPVKPVPHSNPDWYHQDVWWSYNGKLPEAEAAQGCPVKSGVLSTKPVW